MWTPPAAASVLMGSTSPLFTTALFSVDGAGALEWTSSNLAGNRPGALLIGGEYVMPGPAPSLPLQILDRNGVFQTLSLPQGGFVNEDIAALPGGGFLALSQRYNFTVPEESALAAHDAAGQELWRLELESILPGTGSVQGIAVDQRGNPVVASSGVAMGVPAPRTSELVIGAVQGVEECAPTVPNSSGASSRLDAVGSDFAARNDLTLVFSDLPAGQTILALNSEVGGFAPGAGGSQGTLCLGPGIGRFTGPGDIRISDATGRATLRVDLSQVPRPSIFAASMAGDTWLFQGWHRDQNPGQTSNFTNAVRVLLR